MTIQKVGLDFFPLNVNLEQDDKFALVVAKHGIIGFAVLIKMYSKIYADKGYYYEWNEDTQLLFSSKIGVEHNKVLNIIQDSIKWKIFNEDKFKKYGILTSERIQKTYLDITNRRLKVEILKTHLLLDGKNVNIINKNVYIISQDVDILNDSEDQSKVKESKVKESKVIKDIYPPKIKYSDFVLMSEEENQKLIDKYGKENTLAFIEKLNLHKGSKGAKYKSDYLAILNWVVEAVLNKGGGKNGNSKSGNTSNNSGNNKRFANEREYSEEEQRIIDSKFYS